MNTDFYQQFLQICESDSIAKAAQKTFMTPQGLSRAVRQAESELGVSLISRSSRGISITAEGQAFKRYCEKTIRELASTREIMKELSVGKRILEFGATYGSLVPIGENFYLNYNDRNDKTEVKWTFGNDKEIELGLLQCSYEIGLLSSPFPSEVETDTLVKYQLCAWIHESDPLSEKSSISVLDLSDREILDVGPQFKPHHILADAFHSAGIQPRFSPIFTDKYLLMQQTVHNRGISIALENDDIFVSGLPLKSVPIEKTELTFALCWLKGHHLDSAEIDFARALHEEADKECRFISQRRTEASGCS